MKSHLITTFGCTYHFTTTDSLIPEEKLKLPPPRPQALHIVSTNEKKGKLMMAPHDQGHNHLSPWARRPTALDGIFAAFLTGALATQATWSPGRSPRRHDCPAAPSPVEGALAARQHCCLPHQRTASHRRVGAWAAAPASPSHRNHTRRFPTHPSPSCKSSLQSSKFQFTHSPAELFAQYNLCNKYPRHYPPAA
jgi:hypothetical protein